MKVSQKRLLAKFVLWMTIVCTLMSVLLAFLWTQAVDAVNPGPIPPRFRADFIYEEITGGVLTGALIGMAMALYARVDRWMIRRLARFRLALLIVAMIASLVYLGGIFHIAHSSAFRHSLFDFIVMVAGYPEIAAMPTTILLIFGTLAKYATIGFMSLYLAGKYWRETTQLSLKRKAESPIDDRGLAENRSF